MVDSKPRVDPKPMVDPIPKMDPIPLGDPNPVHAIPILKRTIAFDAGLKRPFPLVRLLKCS